MTRRKNTDIKNFTVVIYRTALHWFHLLLNNIVFK